MTKIETIELYGVITKITAISAHVVIVDVKEEGTDKVWEVVLADDMRTPFYLEEGLHVYARGAKALGGIFADCFEEWGRVCAVCGKWHTEGYYVLENDYACSEECAVYLYHGDWNAFKADLALLDFPDTADNAPTYWTEWE